MTMREMSVGTLCVVIIVCLSLTSVASEDSFEDGVSFGWERAPLIETGNLGRADSPEMVVDDTGVVHLATTDPYLSPLPS